MLGKLAQLFQPYDVARLPGTDGRGQAARLRRLADAVVELRQFLGQSLVDPPYVGQVPPHIAAAQDGEQENDRGGEDGRFLAADAPREAARIEEIHGGWTALRFVDEH